MTDFIFLGSKITADVTADQLSHSVLSNSVGPHESQHTRPPCPSAVGGSELSIFLLCHFGHSLKNFQSNLGHFPNMLWILVSYENH